MVKWEIVLALAFAMVSAPVAAQEVDEGAPPSSVPAGSGYPDKPTKQSPTWKERQEAATRAAALAEQREADDRARLAQQYQVPRWHPECNVYWQRGGPIAGLVVSPVFLGAGGGLIGVGVGDEDRNGDRTGGGKAMIATGAISLAAGLATMIATGHLLRQRNGKIYRQRLLGCPSYR